MTWNKIEDIIPDLKPLLDVTPDAICILNPQGEVIYCNQFYEKMCRRGTSELVEDVRCIRVDDRDVGKVAVYHDIIEVSLHSKYRRKEERNG